jgi:hypothetical protein
VLLKFRLCLEDLAALVANVLNVAVSSLVFVGLERVRVVELERAHRAWPLGRLRLFMNGHVLIQSGVTLSELQSDMSVKYIRDLGRKRV